MVTQSELERLQDRGLIQIPLLVAVLTKAKEKEMSWKFVCDYGETFFPEDNTYTSDVEESIKHQSDTDQFRIMFKNGSWILWVACNSYELDKLADYTTDLDWIGDMYDTYDK